MLNGWTWDLGANFYVNNNKLVSLASGQTRDENNWWFVGHNINAIFDYEKGGFVAKGRSIPERVGARRKYRHDQSEIYRRI